MWVKLPDFKYDYMAFDKVRCDIFMSPVTITLSLLVFSIVMFVWEKIPLAVTAMIVCITLVVTGVLQRSSQKFV